MVAGLRVGAVPAVAQTPAVAQAPATAATTAPPKTLPLRYDEDYRYLRDPDRRTNGLDPLKYQSLRGAAHPDWFLTLGGEGRVFFERYRNEQWGRVPTDANGYWLFRTMLHASVRLGPHVRLFAELKSGLAAGQRNGPRPPDVDELDLNQGFVDLNIGPVSDADGTTPLVLRLGRQELEYGAGRLISVRELPNVRQTFDGGRLLLRAGAWRAEAFGLRPAATKRGVFDDNTDRTQALWGGYATRPLGTAPGSGLHLDLFYLGNQRDVGIFAEGRAAETRHSGGGRLWYRTPALASDLEATYQAGTFGPGRIRAWSVSSSTTVSWPQAPLHPALGLNLGANSGDRDPTNPDNQTFFPPAPRGAYFGAVGANGPPNILGFAPTLRLTPAPGLTVLGYCYFFWRQSLRDGVYNVPGFPIRSPGPGRARYIGTQPELDASWQFSRYLSLTASYAYFGAGQFIRDAPPAADIQYLATWLTFKF
ncbi:alginate export family protein [Hymenobacter lapidiphilus]|uniref:Alginate export family protein n=1 Tax=Hymenobacter lapidiphilus TaxID=2608003 RepID=A0A7Y7U5Z9_9BACT|nr:alginate export family protein [Hymenobacter lapidiphilus]NVO32281.1 alginate export family protein [Hymenobacter lapidiphilus]